MLAFLFVYIPSFGQRKPDIDDKDTTINVTAIAERIEINKTSCYSQIKEQLFEMCPSLNERNRLKLSAQIMICERINDNRFDLLHDATDEIEFIQKLSNEDLQLLSHYVVHLDYICYSIANQVQAEFSNKKSNDLFSAMTLISTYVSDLSERHKQENIKMKEKLEKLSKEISENTDSMNKAMDLIINLYQSIDRITTTITSVRDYFKTHIRYFYFLVYAFLLSFIVPNIFPLIFSVTLLKIILDTYISVTSVVLNKITMSIYYASCTMILIICFYLRVQEIKNRIFGPPKHHI
ncbi:hypothetical protein TVAG_489600 [Trichomonas vaginalis G3]|uniref:Uncharacterized protein n=1 Tax=Trichomonas vaginalis (strain ATCC PRA-98 / G3) TaxID=412133 RepID=A2FEJ6_TRIV3|nr:hypothetical protein TVAGG3_0878110 [Trichomonas vaginalis G3]EAX96678.1 hypothetical protein TVAG_489600 [Trichomonas vaginalis G3]KAI5501837.1 hypothetical protein TVAGG3_0878110 [Trichomonas vaginalis G3]|eukprot:XP_001309608.1 hypothetical protein [Trichomonas vaginalis G3]